jgi:uncharacterized LabA/DUF88 family protein
MKLSQQHNSYFKHRLRQVETEAQKTHSLPRVAVYIDGFNLYYGLKEARYEKYLWLDVHRLSGRFLHPGQTLCSVKYFTARVSSPVDKQRRQTAYLEALESHTPAQLIFGTFQETDAQCRSCGAVWKKQEEKKTDVAIATEIIMDAVNDVFDLAILVSGDGDLVPPVLAVRSKWPDKRFTAMFPPFRKSFQLQSVCHFKRDVTQKHLRVSQLPDEVIRQSDGFKLARPPQWR